MSDFANGIGDTAYKEHEGYKEGMDPAFSTPWDSFILTLPKFNVLGVEGVYVGSSDETKIGQTTQKSIETTQKSIETTQKKLETTQKISVMQKAILEFLNEHPEASRRIMVQSLEGITEDGIKYNLKALQEKGILKHIGPDKGGHWEIIK